MNIKEYLFNMKEKLLKSKKDNSEAMIETVEEDVKSDNVVDALDGILNDASDKFFPKEGSWYSSCFRRGTELRKGNLPCNLRNNKWMALMLKEDQNLLMISTRYIEKYMKRSEHFNECRHNYELEIVKWQINWMRNGGEGWIVDEELGGDFFMMSPVCDIAFRKGIVDTLTRIGMDREVVEEGIEKNANMWRERYMRSAFSNEYDPIYLKCSFSLFGEEIKSDDMNEPTLGDVDPSFEEGWMKLRRYEYYIEHKDSVDKYGVVLPEMVMTGEELKKLQTEVAEKAELRRKEIEEYKESKERVTMKRLGKK